MSVKHLDVVEKAKRIRFILSTAFPATRFWVRSDRFSLGSSVDVDWLDGPTEDMVKAVVWPFERVDRDERTGEILSGGNSYVQCHRSISAEVDGTVKAYVRSRFADFERASEWDIGFTTQV